MSNFWHGPQVSRSAKKGAAKGLLEAADHLLAASQPLVPVSDRKGGGFLRDSGVTSVDESIPASAVAYTAVSADDPPHYAVKVHETMGWRHPTGQAKFLEQPLNSEKAALLEIIAGAIKGALGA
jgi:hypothetical protein